MRDIFKPVSGQVRAWHSGDFFSCAIRIIRNNCMCGKICPKNVTNWCVSLSPVYHTYHVQHVSLQLQVCQNLSHKCDQLLSLSHVYHTDHMQCVSYITTAGNLGFNRKTSRKSIRSRAQKKDDVSMPAYVACAAADFIVLGPPQPVLGPSLAVFGPR